MICRDSKGRFVKGNQQPKEWVTKRILVTKGISLSKEHKEKISKSNTGRLVSPETRKKIGNANKISLIGNKCSKETRLKMSESHKGKNTGERNPMFKCGETLRSGYVFILKPNHILANNAGYVQRSHLIWYENTGEIINLPSIIHHKNFIITDDRIENLQKMDLKSHSIFHNNLRKNG